MLVKAAECGITPSEFWKMTWKDFQVMVLGKERNEVNEWRRIRSVVHILYAANTSDKPARPAHEIMPLPGDPKTDRGKPLTKEEVKKTFKVFGIA